MKSAEIQSLDNQQNSTQWSLGLPSLPSNFQDNQQAVYDQINQLFKEQDQQKDIIAEAREILGDSAKNLKDDEIYDLINEIQYLVDTWLEEFERKAFKGKTFNELLDLEA